MVLTPEQLKTPEQREKNRLRQRRFSNKRTPGAHVAKAQERFLEMIEGGQSRADAIAGVGRQPSTLEQWLQRYPDFKAAVVRAETRAKREHEPTFAAFDADFRDKYFRFATPAHMQEILDAINEASAVAKEKKEPQAVLILAPPDHAKSSVVEDFLAWRIATDPNVRCLLISKTLGAAKKRTGRIQRRLTDRAMFPEFVDDYGPFKSEVRADARPWTSEFFTVIGQDSGERDYTLQALGIGGQVYGTRSEVIILDDIADLANQTPAEIDKQFEYIQVEVRSRLVEDGVLICIGTHMRERDIYTRLEELGLFDKVLKFKAITETEDGEEKALWPARYPLKRLHNIKGKTDPRIWELVYQQNPLPSVGAIFTQEMMESCYDEDRYIGHVPRDSIVVAGVDPSVENYTAAVVFALKQTESGEWMRYLVDVRNEKGLTGEGGDKQMGVVDFIVNVCEEYNVSILCVEDGTWMSLINRSFSLRSRLQQLGVVHHGIKVTEQSVGPEAIRQLSGIFSYRLISIPGSPNARQYLATMFNQFLTFTGNKQHWRKLFDIVKAFNMAEHAVQMMFSTKKEGVKQVAGEDTPDWILANA